MLDTAAHPSVRVRLIDDDRDWDELASDWSQLFELSPYSSAALHFDWLRTWWWTFGPAYGQHDRGLRIITVWRGHRLIGILPLYQNTVGTIPGVRHLRFLSTGEARFEATWPEYLNLLCLPEEENACLEACRDTLRDLVWDYLELLDVPAESPLLRLSEASSRRDRVSAVLRGHCPVANLEGGFDAYLGRLSTNGRQHARRLLRDGDRRGIVFELASGPDTDRSFDRLVALHQERWTEVGKPGCFAAKRFTEFHRSLARVWVPCGSAVLATLSLHGEAVACLYGFLSKSKFDIYQSGVKMKASAGLRSPGVLAHLLLMRTLAERGIQRYDFLLGTSPYKTRLATDHNVLFALRCWRPSIRSAAYAVSRWLGRSVRDGVRSLLRSPLAQTTAVKIGPKR